MTFREGVPATEFSEVFVEGMKDRMAISYYKYGEVAKAFPAKAGAVGCMESHIAAYAEDGNTEHLVDAANYLMIEFMHPSHPAAHFTPTDSDGSLGRVDRDGETSHADNSDIGVDATTLAMRKRYS